MLTNKMQDGNNPPTRMPNPTTRSSREDTSSSRLRMVGDTKKGVIELVRSFGLGFQGTH